jgi:hypothetical protein
VAAHKNSTTAATTFIPSLFLLGGYEFFSFTAASVEAADKNSYDGRLEISKIPPLGYVFLFAAVRTLLFHFLLFLGTCRWS